MPPEEIDEAAILASGARDADTEAMLAIREVEQQIETVVSETAILSARQIAAKTQIAFEDPKLKPKSIAKRIEERADIYNRIGLKSQVGAASYSVRREICHELGLVEISDTRAFEVLALDTYKGKVRQVFDKFRWEFFYNDVKGCQEDNWTGNSILYYSRSRLLKGATALMTTLSKLRTEMPVEIAQNIGIVKPWNLFNSFCVMAECSAVGKGDSKSMNSGNTAIVLGTIEKVQPNGEGVYMAVEPTYFVLGIW